MNETQLLADYARAFAEIRARYLEEGDGLNSGPCEVRGDDYRPAGKFLGVIPRPFRPIPEIADLRAYIAAQAAPAGRSACHV